MAPSRVTAGRPSVSPDRWSGPGSPPRRGTRRGRACASTTARCRAVARARLCEPGRRGAAALDVAPEFVEREAAAPTVLTIAPQMRAAGRSGCRGADARAHSQAVADATAEELQKARGRLGSMADHASFEMLIEGSDSPLAEWIAARHFDVVLLPARRRLFGRAKHPEAARLQASTSAEVRVVDPKTKSRPNPGEPSRSALQRASA
jgi:hypothetical protein